jgi:hypothetical protein
MRILRLNCLVLVGALMASGSWAAAEETSHDKPSVCRTLCPSMACPASCQGKKPDQDLSQRSDGPHQGGYEAIQPEASGQKAAPDK